MIEVSWLGRVPYAQAWDLQKQLVAALAAGEISDQFLLLEHDPVYTLGRSGKLEHLLLDEDARNREGITLHWVDRGGDITYHGPGQLVGYPILDLRRLQQARGAKHLDLHRYLRDLEEVIIGALGAFGVTAWRFPGYTGVWVDGTHDPLKIAAIGVKVNSRGVTSHGFALNVDPSLAHFAGIVPCGIRDHGVTSLTQLLQRPVALDEVRAQLIDEFQEVFQVETAFVAPPLSA